MTSRTTKPVDARPINLSRQSIYVHNWYVIQRLPAHPGSLWRWKFAVGPRLALALAYNANACLTADPSQN